MAQGVFVQFSGPQIAYWAEKLRQAGMRVIGIEPETFDILTNCTKFRSLINELGMAQPDFEIVKTPFHLFEAMKRIKYPVLIRPEEKTFPQVTDSILVISDDLTMRRHFDPENQQAFATPYMVEHFFEFAIECEVDALYDGKEVFIPTVLEHIELAGVHSTDSACVTPPYCIPLRHVETIYEYARKILHKLNFKGLMTIRFSIINDTVYVLEATPWANRTLPLTSKICNIPMAYAATQILLGKSLADLKLKPPRLPYFGVREAVFPFANFPQVDPLLGPQVYSTGSVLALSDSFGLSYFKSQEAILMPLPLEGSVLITVTDADKPSILEPARLFKEMGFRIKATKGTQQFLKKHGIAAETVRKLGFGRPNLVDAIKTGEVDLVINTPSGKQSQIDDADIRKAAIQCKVPNITTPAGALAAAKGIAARLKGRPKVKSLKEYYDLF
jgi:carbamoyl-phosphate synthase large subunit